MSEHVYNDDGDCEACGVNRTRCEPVQVRTVSTPAPTTGAAGEWTEVKADNIPTESSEQQAWDAVREAAIQLNGRDQEIAALREQLEQTTERYCKCVDEHATALLDLSEARRQLTEAQAALKQVNDEAERAALWIGHAEQHLPGNITLAEIGVRVDRIRNLSLGSPSQDARGGSPKESAGAPSGQTAGVASQKAGQPQ